MNKEKLLLFNPFETKKKRLDSIKYEEINE